MTKHFDVIVVGLGPVGTLLTLLLNQAGIKVLGIDKDISIFPLPRAANIDDEGLRIMQRVNLESAYSDHSSNPSGAIFTD
ncbi:MAG: FAD-dependent monooxygenase, partial [Pseudomonadota bacterium]|nr:FAD-dependent monooxygenase [Pseudomonadota bacterium]